MTTARAMEILQAALRHGGQPVTVTQREVDAAVVQIVCTRACRVCGSRVGQYCDARGGLHLSAPWSRRKRCRSRRPPPVVAPFPYAGGKSAIAAEIWARFGDPMNYCEPLCGSAAVLLARLSAPGTETVNDIDGFLINCYRAIQADPEAVARWASWPVSECDLHARHAWLIARRGDLTARLDGGPDYSDAKIAGWWLWGACCWIGSGWCSGKGPWQVIDGKLVNTGDAGRGIHRKLPHLGDAGRGIHRKLPHLGNAGQGIYRQLPHLGDAGRGIYRQLPHLGDAGREDLLAYLGLLSQRLARVRITCGPWERVLGPSVTTHHGLTAVLLDPPYRDDEHSFGYVAGGQCWEACWAWAVAHGDDPLFRIALCGYDDGRSLPSGWTAYHWKARGGYGSQGNGRGRENCVREVLYCSPHCLKPIDELPLFAEEARGDA